MNKTDRTFLTLKYRTINISSHTLFIDGFGEIVIALDKEDNVCNPKLHPRLRAQYRLDQLRKKKDQI